MVKNAITIIISVLFSSSVFASTVAETDTANYFEKIKQDPTKLQSFLYAMPKGGDLHLHESGAAFAENLVGYAANDNLCLNRKTFEAYTNPNCNKEDLLVNALTNKSMMHDIVTAWSMQDFKPGKESAHDHFFAAFGKFSAITRVHHAEMLAELSERAEQQNEQYVEVMLTTDAGRGAALGEQIGWSDDIESVWSKIKAANIDDIVKYASQQLSADEAKKAEILGCKTNSKKAGCGIKVRYISQIGREQVPARVFGQMVAAFELASKDSRVVGLNLVQAEDGKLSSRDYDLHMKMLAFLHQKYPTTHITLHAGELSDAVTQPDMMKSHIRDAVEIARAERIGHGVDIEKEIDYQALLDDMAAWHVLVEINLSSNEIILDVVGRQHPLPLYMQHQVPLALSTDDEGVSRSMLTREYVKATQEFNLSYLQLKTFARNSIAYSFLPGRTLWQDDSYHKVMPACAKDMLGDAHPSTSCRRFLEKNEKANMQWELENHFNLFENNKNH